LLLSEVSELESVSAFLFVARCPGAMRDTDENNIKVFFFSVSGWNIWRF